MATVETGPGSDRFEDLLKEFRNKLRSKKSIITDEIFWSEEGVTILDLIAALHVENMDLQNRLNNRAGELSTFPAGGNIMAIPSGKTTINLVEGEVTVPKLTTKSYPFTGLKELGTDKFRSASFFLDQPANVRIDDRPAFPMAMGVNRFHFNMREKIEINSAVPMAIALQFSTGDEVPTEAVRGGYDFWRHGLLSPTTNGFQTIRLRPKSIDFALRGSLGLFTRTLLPASALESGDEGSPVVAGLRQMTMIVENEDDTDSANFKALVNTGEGETKGAHPVTGDNGIPVAKGDLAIINFDNENYYRMDVQAKSTVSGSPASTVKATLKGVWE